MIRTSASRLPHAIRAVLPLGVLLALGLAVSGCDTVRSWTGRHSDLQQNFDPTKISVEELYNNGVDALNAKRYKAATMMFDLVEQTYPYSSWAVSARLMQGYAQYLQNQYLEGIGILDRFIQLHPAHRDVSYAYYLRALNYYEQISDVQRDQKATEEAITALQEVVNRFPNSAYARDARLKIDLGRDHLAGHEMSVGRWYEKQRLYSAAIGRFQRVVDEYQTTNHVPEAQHRMTEIYLLLGLRDLAKKTAAVLGHNYPGNEWYAESYNQMLEAGEVRPVEGVAPAKPGFLSRTFRSIF
ncbi:MAG: outer membrane protein assembly factor BamD [Acetobacteraceae bacterium]|nr:outer membrane protein assembly factor BamD [Acetobacteraceae bacterium]